MISRGSRTRVRRRRACHLPASDMTAGASDPDVAVISPALDAHATASAPAE